MTRRLIAAFACVAVMAGVAPGASALTAMTLTQIQPLSFGTIATSDGSGTVTISPSGTRTTTGGVIPINTDQGQAGVFDVTGDPTAPAFAVNVSPSATLSNGSATMGLDAFVTNPPIGMNGTLANGRATLYVGGTLHVEANQPRGAYTGHYTVTVDYY